MIFTYRYGWSICKTYIVIFRGKSNDFIFRPWCCAESVSSFLFTDGNSISCQFCSPAQSTMTIISHTASSISWAEQGRTTTKRLIYKSSTSQKLCSLKNPYSLFWKYCLWKKFAFTCSWTFVKSTLLRSLNIWETWDEFCKTALAAWARWFKPVYLLKVCAKDLTALI